MEFGFIIYIILSSLFGDTIRMMQQQIWNSTAPEESDDNKIGEQDDVVNDSQDQTIGFCVKNAVLFPPEVEKGRWPEDYSLSDHARLTVVFSPIRMPCSQLIC